MYEPTWGGVVSQGGLADHDSDYGNGWYNDHHSTAAPPDATPTLLPLTLPLNPYP